MSIVHWNSVLMQEMADCDNNRTPAIFQRSDNLIFVGVIAGYAAGSLIGFIRIGKKPFPCDRLQFRNILVTFLYGLFIYP